jgi:hypothetical protein
MNAEKTTLTIFYGLYFAIIYLCTQISLLLVEALTYVVIVIWIFPKIISVFTRYSQNGLAYDELPRPVVFLLKNNEFLDFMLVGLFFGVFIGRPYKLSGFEPYTRIILIIIPLLSTLLNYFLYKRFPLPRQRLVVLAFQFFFLLFLMEKIDDIIPNRIILAYGLLCWIITYSFIKLITDPPSKDFGLFLDEDLFYIFFPIYIYLLVPIQVLILITIWYDQPDYLFFTILPTILFFTLIASHLVCKLLGEPIGSSKLKKIIGGSLVGIMVLYTQLGYEIILELIIKPSNWEYVEFEIFGFHYKIIPIMLFYAIGYSWIVALQLYFLRVRTYESQYQKYLGPRTSYVINSREQIA